MINSYSESDILLIATQEHLLHPLADLTDYYKLFFQSYYGQGHFFRSDIVAKLKLENELLILDKPYLPLVQDISNRNGLYRISLEAIRKEILTLDEYLILFLNKHKGHVNWQQWHNNWETITGILFRLYPDLREERIIKHCTEVIDNKAMISHSDLYRQTYHPHYRVMSLNEYEIIKFTDLKEFI